jgi:hypothetical protein
MLANVQELSSRIREIAEREQHQRANEKAPDLTNLPVY